MRNQYVTSGGTKSSATLKSAGATNGDSVFVIQNCSTTVMKIKFGSSASTSDFDVILPACTSQDDGTSIPIVLENYPNDSDLTAFSSGTLRYTLSYR
jgi:hypothetical protein